MQTLQIYEKTCQQFSLQYDFSREPIAPQMEFINFALDAVFQLAEGLFEPLKIDLRLVYFEQEYDSEEKTDLPNPVSVLKQKGLAENINTRNYWIGDDVDSVDRITKTQALDWATQAMASNPDQEGLSVGLAQMIFKTTRCCLPIGQDHLVEGLLPVKERNDMYQHPVEIKDGQIWVAGPTRPYALYAPIEVMVEKEYEVITLRLYFYWSIYAIPDQTGITPARQAIDTLLNQGWTLEFEHIRESY